MVLSLFKAVVRRLQLPTRAPAPAADGKHAEIGSRRKEEEKYPFFLLPESASSLPLFSQLLRPMC